MGLHQCQLLQRDSFFETMLKSASARLREVKACESDGFHFAWSSLCAEQTRFGYARLCCHHCSNLLYLVVSALFYLVRHDPH